VAMDIYSVKDGKLTYVKEVDFQTKKDMQELCDNNLKELFNLELVKSHLTIKSVSIDTLAFDPKTNAFVVIEYLKSVNLNAIKQGYSYLYLVDNNRSDFMSMLNERGIRSIRKNDINWSKARVLFVASSFSLNQEINFDEQTPFELWQIKKYANDIITLEQIKLVVNTEDKHLSGVPDDIKELYKKIKGLILSIDDNIRVEPKKHYIAFITKTNFTDIEIHKKELKIYLNLKKGSLNDNKNLASDVSNVGHWGNGDYMVRVNNNTDLDYLLTLIKQSYEKNSA
jgi:predicted transport protein